MLRAKRGVQIAAAVALLAVGPQVLGVGEDGSFVAYGVGSQSCGKFIGAADKGTHQENWGDWNRYAQWTMGYLSATNKRMDNTADILGGTDGDGIMGWIKQYWRENPLKTYLGANIALIVELYPNRITK